MKWLFERPRQKANFDYACAGVWESIRALYIFKKKTERTSELEILIINLNMSQSRCFYNFSLNLFSLFHYSSPPINVLSFCKLPKLIPLYFFYFQHVDIPTKNFYMVAGQTNMYVFAYAYVHSCAQLPDKHMNSEFTNSLKRQFQF